VTQAFDDDLIGGRYRLIRQVGQGGMGTVWQARDELLDRGVAIKQLASPFGPAEGRAEQVERIRREARMAARLDHIGVVRVYDIIDWAGSPAIVMEYVKGRSLAARLRESGALTVQETTVLARALLDALRHAHGAGVVHRDLKPDNVLLDGPRVVITDFGIARPLDGATALTRPGAIIGTPAFMAPEQIEGQEVTAAADLWSLGVTLYTSVEGEQPFKGETMAQLCIAVLTRPMPPPRYAGPLTPLLEALLVKDPKARASAEWAARFLAGDAPDEAAGGGSVAVPDGTSVVEIEGRQPRAPVPDLPAPERAASDSPAPDSPSPAPDLPAPDPPALDPPVPDRPEAGIPTGRAVAFANEPTAAAPTAQPRPPARPVEAAPQTAPQTAPQAAPETGRRPQPVRRLRRRAVVIPAACTVLAASVAVFVILTAPGTSHAHTGNLGIAGTGSGSPRGSGSGSSSPTASVTGGLAAFTVPGGNMTSMTLAPNGVTLAVGSNNGEVFLWNTATRKIGATLVDPGGFGVGALAFAPDGATLAVGDDNGSTYLWNISTRKVSATLPPSWGTEIVTALAFAPNGATLAAGVGTRGEGAGGAYAWDVATGKMTNTFDDPSLGNGVRAVAFAPDGRTVAVGDTAGGISLWNSATGNTTATYTTPDGSSVGALAFGPDGSRTLAVGGGTGDIYLWNTATGKNTAGFTDPGGSGVGALAFAPKNGGTLAVGDDDGSTYLWNTATGKNTATFAPRGVSAVVVGVAFAPDDATLFVGNSGGDIYVWRT
jgi:serine/threonine protein kinase